MGEPITVGGGGGVGGTGRPPGRISCGFDENDFHDPEPGNNKKKLFKHPGWQIKTLIITTASSGRVDHSADLPQDGNCLVEIMCSGSGDDVTIHGNPFGIEVDTRTYTGSGHTNPNSNSFIKNVVINAGGNLKNLGPFQKSDQCVVCADHVPNGC